MHYGTSAQVAGPAGRLYLSRNTAKRAGKDQPMANDALAEAPHTIPRHIHAVLDCLLDGGDGVALITALITANFIGDNLSARGNTGNDTAVDVKDAGRHATIPRRCGCRVGAMTVVVTRRAELIRKEWLHRLVGSHKAIGADQLVIAGKGRIARHCTAKVAVVGTTFWRIGLAGGVGALRQRRGV